MIDFEKTKFQRSQYYLLWSTQLLQNNYNITFFDFLNETFYKGQPGQITNIKQRYYELLDNPGFKQKYLESPLSKQEDEQIEIGNLFD